MTLVKFPFGRSARFSVRHAHRLQTTDVEAKAEPVSTSRERLAAAKHIDGFIACLDASELRFTGDQGARATEQPSLKRLDVIDEQKDGRPS